MNFSKKKLLFVLSLLFFLSHINALNIIYNSNCCQKITHSDNNKKLCHGPNSAAAGPHDNRINKAKCAKHSITTQRNADLILENSLCDCNQPLEVEQGTLSDTKLPNSLPKIGHQIWVADFLNKIWLTHITNPERVLAFEYERTRVNLHSRILPLYLQHQSLLI